MEAGDIKSSSEQGWQVATESDVDRAKGAHAESNRCNTTVRERGSAGLVARKTQRSEQIPHST